MKKPKTLYKPNLYWFWLIASQYCYHCEEDLPEVWTQISTDGIIEKFHCPMCGMFACGENDIEFAIGRIQEVRRKIAEN